MQLPVLYYLFNSKKENFSTDSHVQKIPLETLLYFMFIIYCSTMVSVYATVLCWDISRGTLLNRLTYATFANIFGVFYLIYYFIVHKK
jgi:hypothetical protein